MSFKTKKAREPKGSQAFTTVKNMENGKEQVSRLNG
jgi:hypothetical protein